MPTSFTTLKKQVLDRLANEINPLLAYHNRSHTAEVVENAERIARIEGITGERELLLLMLAALFHDTGFLYVNNGHEEKSCMIAMDELRDWDFEPSERDMICTLIMATKVPQMPQTRLEEIICDADLDYLGRSDFWEISNNLKKEYLGLGTIRSEEEWLPLEIKFLESHRYFTEISKKIRAPEKQKHLKQLKALLKEGSIET